MEHTIRHIDYVNNSSNEVMNACTINKNLEKLFLNDIRMKEISERIREGSIKAYLDGHPYLNNDVVWYRTFNPVSGKTEMFLLRSNISDNIHRPLIEIVDGKVTFTSTGWTDCLEFSTYARNNIDSYISGVYLEDMSIRHQNVNSMHKYGMLSSDTLSGSLLLTDMSNIDKTRENVLYPYQTIYLSSDNTILSGYCRKWDCGLLEYNIVFRLGFTGKTVTNNGILYELVCCNSLVLSDKTYYCDISDSNIFSTSSDISSEYTYINRMAETNHDRYVNTYSSRILFQIPFSDSNYMIFGSNIRNFCQDVSNPSIGYNDSVLTYTNRRNDGITPVYITYTHDRYTKTALVLNNFCCKIVGKWTAS